MIKKVCFTILFAFAVTYVFPQQIHFLLKDIYPKDLSLGADRTGIYLPMLKEKRVALCVNHTSTIGKTHLLDTLLAMKVNVVKIFSPEHGFRGNVEAGKTIDHSKDKKTGLPIVSLYGQNKKPQPKDLEDVDVVIFDIQDVGARFYTYISTLHYVMEAAAESKKTVIVLDRPNPNGYWVDGPVLEKTFTSFVGMHPVPIAHGMTVGEYAHMINGEKWLANAIQCDLKVINMLQYHHTFRYQLPIMPSPNLSSMTAIYIYPSLCLFEGTPLSVGRGTDEPFCVVGYPNSPIGNHAFTPKNIPHVATNVPFQNKLCTGYDLTKIGDIILKNKNFINLEWIIEMYNNYPDKKSFFTPFFDKLAGTDKVRKQIMEGKSAIEIRTSWEEDLKAFKIIRKKYLLYGDFE